MSRPPVILQQRLAFRDPHDCTDSADALALLEACFDAPVRRGTDGRFHPALAESWTVSDDARTWRFRLRPGLRFHDGSPLDAAAMRFSIERMKRPEIGATLGAPAVWRQYLGEAEVRDESALDFSIALPEPLADLLDILSSAYALPPHLADAPDFLAKPVGSGAFRVESVAADEIVMSANPGWWAGPPANPALLWRREPESRARAAALAQGTAAAATRLLPADAAALDPVRITRHEHIDPTAIIFLLNAAKGPLAEARLRRALSLAIDREALVAEVLGGAGRPLAGFVSPHHFGAVPEARAACDPAEARRLLTEAGHGDGLTLAADCPTSLPDEAEALTAALGRQLARVGVRLEPHIVADRTRYAEQVRDKKIHDLCVFDSSPMSTFRVLYEKIDSRVKGSWWEGYRNREVEALLDEARRTVETGRREAIYRRAFALLQADPPWLTLYNHTRTAALAGRHQGWRMRPDGILDAARLPQLD